MQQQTCPHCGAPLPEGAVFCPHCARDVHPRKDTKRPAPLRKKLLAGLLALLVVIAAGAGIWYANRPYVPREYDGVGEVYYETGGRTYQLLVAWPADRCAPAPDIYQYGREDDLTRWPSRFYVNDAANGADAWGEFEPLVEQVTVEVVQDENAGSTLTAESPAQDENYPDAAGTSILEFDGLCGEPQVVWNVQMKNGDVLRVRQNIHVTLIHTYTYDWHDYPMDTLEELQALLDRVVTEVQPMDELIFNLPPVTYEGTLTLPNTCTLQGCTDGSGRTVFAGSVLATPEQGYWLNYLFDIDFVGNGSNVGLSASISTIAIGCTFTGYKTGILSYGSAWTAPVECTFTGNQVGFHFNSVDGGVSRALFDNNVFTGNGTAVLLENVSADGTIYFDGSVFSGNGTDIDNRCGYDVDTSKAVFE
ncbi:zinc ribbon domain-containing protein [Intestinimonas massiliensis (ex Afouda et al. 2020)]|uniref:zinc ribbon domain-containing protein n=1 Tax=Intestinimonas massiliensis (ex Afouda et al. 2020) TaxID=1673721 RepID=UPI0013EEF4CE|nr:zinc ribbon domain-containing protein [Intestinimonas massiliensis (ex Afouda et al. 2020)]